MPRWAWASCRSQQALLLAHNNLPITTQPSPSNHGLTFVGPPLSATVQEHADYDGPALRWGLTFKLASAARCCQACKEVRRCRGRQHGV